ncbi:MAG: UDP-2,4-diacetamido-2,4,6-trideoxy-beta-L-altropyranose hydrolase [Nitrospirae bacterium]|nr:UDP-2,4-diacetamido-2,4,6-trideoxy-beta-L-altropyranose hydrolase [Nitrospirota bacterium]
MIKAEKLKIGFRVDSSYEIGTGHIMRCLSLAEGLQEKNAEVIFISRKLSGNIIDVIKKQGYKVFTLKYDADILKPNALKCRYKEWLGVPYERDIQETKEILVKRHLSLDWLVVDHYAIDKKWEEQIRPFTNKIMVIDDLADRSHDCDLLLNQNIFPDMEGRYKNLIPVYSKKLFGPKHALLRREFAEARKRLKERNGIVKRILIFFGGIDKTNETEKALKALRILNEPSIEIDVVVGKMNERKDTIRRYCESMPKTRFYCQIDNMAEMMASADMAICAGGIATWERCCVGLPSLVVTTADNQIEAIRILDKRSILRYLGENTKVSADYIAEDVRLLLKSRQLLTQYSRNSLMLVDGLGVRRCASEVVLYGSMEKRELKLEVS